MTPKNENLPMNADLSMAEGGTITYATEVIAIIAGVAANEIEGLAGMCTSGGLGDIISKNRNITRGVKVEVGTEEVSVDLYVIIEYGQPIQKVASEVQENVRKNIEAMTGLRVVRVDVHVQGVSFEKEKREVQQTLSDAHVPSLAEPHKAAEQPSPLTVEVVAEEKDDEDLASEDLEDSRDPASGEREPDMKENED